MGASKSKSPSHLSLGSTPSHGNPKSTSSLNTELNNIARNTDDTAKARALVAAGADLSSTNGPDWRHTPLHQAAFHGRYEMAKALVELGARLDLHSNPCGRGATGTPLELARGGGHHRIAAMLEKAAAGQAPVHKAEAPSATLATPLAEAAWNGDLNKVRSLLGRGAPPNTEAYGGFSNGHHSALNGAARNGHAAIVKMLLEQDVKPDIESRCQGPWEVTPLQQAGYHGRAECAKILLEHGASTTSRSGPGCGHQTAKEIAQQMRNGQWKQFVAVLDAPHNGKSAVEQPIKTAGAKGTWRKYTNIDMCFQGDAEIIGDWKHHHTIESLKRIVEQKGYSAVCVGSFGHAALKNFDYQLTAEDCKPSQGYTNELYIWFPETNAKPPKAPEAPRPDLPAGFRFHSGYGEAPRADQTQHIPMIEGHCFGGDKFNWPLQWAAMIGDVAAIEALVASGHDPNVKMGCWFDSEPLGWAASFGQCKAIEALCAAGADPRRPANTSGNTPLSDAQREGHSKAIELLNEYLSGARPIGKPVPKPVEGSSWFGGMAAVIGTPVVDAAAGAKAAPPPLHEMVKKLRVELGMPDDLPMAEAVDRAITELGVDVGKGAAVVEKAEAAWRVIS